MDYHQSVMQREVLEFLRVKKGGLYLDCTLGDGGYSLAIIKMEGRIVGIDQDQESLERVKARFEEEGLEKERYQIIKGNFRDLKTLVNEKFQGIVFDLGVSSNELDDAVRGFSFSKEAHLDMRMDRNLAVRAMDLVNGLNKDELEKLFQVYGEISDKRVVKAIIKARQEQTIETTTELARIIEAVLRRRSGQIHPATLVFQALRIAVNDELNSLKEALPRALELLDKGGRLVVVSF